MSTCLKDLTVDPENLGQLQTLLLKRGTTDRPGFKMSKEFEMHKALLIHLEFLSWNMQVTFSQRQL